MMKTSNQTSKVIKADTTLFLEGDQSGSGYYIESGSVHIWVIRAGEQVSLAKLKPGDFVGECSTIDQAPRSSCATTLENCVLVEFSHQQIANRIQAVDPVLRHLIGALKRRIRSTNNQITKAFGSAIEKPMKEWAEEPLDMSCLEDLLLERDLQRAITNKEFELYFQPIVDLRHMNLAGFEGLIRWNHPQKGVISPNDFIEFAEEKGLITEITKWCVNETCRLIPEFQLAASQNVENLELMQLSVNISGSIISCEAFSAWIKDTLRSSFCPPEMLKLEVTESSLLENMEVAKNTLNHLRDLGVGVAIDDFGTGQSNLAYLNQLPMTTLKIDRSFITSKLDDECNKKVVKLILGLANELDVNVVAEGIETRTELNMLREMNCDYGQGYYFAKPMPLNVALGFVREWQENWHTSPRLVLSRA